MGTPAELPGCRQTRNLWLFHQAEVNASSASRYSSGVGDGNTSGIAWVVANPASYQLFTPLELNQSGQVSFANGFADGNTSGVNYLVNHPGLFGYFTAQEVADSEELAKKAGSAESLATVQADLAQQNLSYVPYLEKMNIKVPTPIIGIINPDWGGSGRPRMFFPIYICPRTKMDLPTGCILTPTAMNPRNSTIIRISSGRRCWIESENHT